ncbi:pilus (MSHA type) biogenesis protein MshL [Pseudomonas sp. ABC1]|nr:pilus (MSHA type) biogenesis protein MshL [Pseudomonas sp. ABC1]
MLKNFPHVGLLGVIGLLTACQSFTDGDKRLYEQSDRLFDESLAQSQQAKVVPPPSVQAALIPQLDMGLPATGRGPRFDVAVHGMPASEFFLSLAESANQNLLVHPQVSGEITFSLRNVTLDEVLTAVRDSYGYDFRRTNYGYQILPNLKYVKTYKLNYLDLEREGTTDTRVSSGQMVSSDSTSANAGGTTNSSSSVTLDASRVSTRNSSDVWVTVRDAVAMIIGIGDLTEVSPQQVVTGDPALAQALGGVLPATAARATAATGNCRQDANGSVCFNSMSGLLIVRASSLEQQKVEQFIREIESNLQRQVILETKILEVSLSDGFQAGINWSYLQGQKGISLGGFGTAANGVNTPNIPLNTPSSALSGADGIGGVFGMTFDFGNFEGVVQLLETQGQVRVLSSPRISTLNNQKAVIKVGTDEFFVTDVSTTTTSLSGGNTSPDMNITLTPFFSGISLDVTPQIDENDQVTLHVRPTVSRVSDQNKSIQLGGADNVFNLPLALSTTRQSDSIVRARSGQVVVIGGLLENSNTNEDSNVPWASKVPLLGKLFQQQRKALEQTELVILMRPQVVSDQVWLDELRKSAESFQQTR